MTWWLSFGSSELGQVLPLVCVSHLSPATYWIFNPCRLGTEMVTSVRVSGWSIFCYRCLTLLKWHFIHVSATSIECRAGLDGMTLWLSFGSYKLRQVLPLVCVSHLSPATYWIFNPCRLGTEMVALVRVIRLVHVLLPVPYTPRVAHVSYIHALRRLTTVVDSGIALILTW